MKAIIPAAGYATRMYPLTLHNPKPLLKVGNKPMLEWVIEKIEKIKDINEILIVTNAKFAHNFEEWHKTYKGRIPVKIINDKTTSNEDRLGSIGDLHLAIASEKIKEDIVIVNSDNLFTFELTDANDFFKKKKANVITLYDVKTIEEARKMGVAEFDRHGKVTSFVEKPQNPSTTMISIGIYFYTAETTRLFKKYLDEGNSPDKTGSFVEWLHKNSEVFVYKFDKKNDLWIDIGTPEMYKEAQRTFPHIAKVKK